MQSANPRANLIGAFCAFCAAICFSLNDVLIKFLSDAYALHQVVLLRALFGLATCVILFMPFNGGLSILKTRRLGAHIFRGLCVVFANTFLFLGLGALPIADAVALFFVSPLVVTVLSVVFLKEKVGVRRWGAIIVGFIGVLLIVRPGTEAFQVASFFPIMAASLYAVMHIVARRIGGTESAVTMATFSTLAFIVVSSLVGLIIGDGRFEGAVPTELDFLVRAWQPLTLEDLPLVAVLGISGFFGVVLISQAYRLSEAAFAAPFEYVSMPLAVIWGVTVFGTWPETIAWAGIALILGSGLYLVWRESRKPAAKTPRRLNQA